MISGDEERFKMMVGKEGLLWTSKEMGLDIESKPIGNIIEVEGLQKYTFKIEKDNKEHKLKLTTEDKINRYTMQFDKPSFGIRSISYMVMESRLHSLEVQH
jgi:hypothetical protein